MTTDLDRLIEAVEEGSATTMKFDDALDGHSPAMAEMAYLGSIDAAVALHEALLPGWGWHCGVYGARAWEYPGDEWNPERRQDVEMPFSPARASLSGEGET